MDCDRLAFGTFLNWLFVAKPLMVQTEKYGAAITLPQFFENRFSDRFHVIRLVSSMFLTEGLNDQEDVFMTIVYELFNPWLWGVFLAAILAAVMCTADSQLLVASSAIIEDILKLIGKLQLSQQKLISKSRWAVVLIVLIGVLVAWNPENKVLDLVAYAWGGFGATFDPVILLSLYWKGMNKRGVLAAIVSGGLVVLIWKQLSCGTTCMKSFQVL